MKLKNQTNSCSRGCKASWWVRLPMKPIKHGLNHSREAVFLDRFRPQGFRAQRDPVRYWVLANRACINRIRCNMCPEIIKTSSTKRWMQELPTTSEEATNFCQLKRRNWRHHRWLTRLPRWIEWHAMLNKSGLWWRMTPSLSVCKINSQIITFSSGSIGGKIRSSRSNASVNMSQLWHWDPKGLATAEEELRRRTFCFCRRSMTMSINLERPNLELVPCQTQPIWRRRCGISRFEMVQIREYMNNWRFKREHQYKMILVAMQKARMLTCQTLIEMKNLERLMGPVKFWLKAMRSITQTYRTAQKRIWAKQMEISTRQLLGCRLVNLWTSVRVWVHQPKERGQLSDWMKRKERGHIKNPPRELLLRSTLRQTATFPWSKANRTSI